MYLDKTYMLVALNMEFATEAQVLEGIALSHDQITALESLDVAMLAKLTDNLNRYSSTPIWPALLGEQLGIASHGPLGYATVSARNPGEAISTFLKWAIVRFECYGYEIIEGQTFVEVVLLDRTGCEPFHNAFFQACARIFEIVVKTLLSNLAGCGMAIHFKQPFSGQQHRALAGKFESQLVFDSEANKVVFPIDIWNTNSPLHDPHTYETNVRLCQQIMQTRTANKRLDSTIKNQLTEYFQGALDGTTRGIGPPKLAQFAEQLHMSERTLSRKLDQQGKSYRDIVLAVRKELAIRALAETNLAVAEISDRLGYTESANFCRAFKKWCGVGPSAYRKANT